MLKQQTLDQNSIAYYILSMPSKEIASLCVLHLMRTLTQEHMRFSIEEAAKNSNLSEPDVEFMTSDCKI